MPQASKRSVLKARQAAMRKQLKHDRQYFRVLEIGWSDVIFRYGGHEIRFEYYQGRLCRKGGDYLYLQPEDYELLFDWADMLLTARQHATKRKQAKQRPTEPVTEQQLAWRF